MARLLLIEYFDFQGRRIDFFRVRFHQSLRNLKYKSKSTKKQRYWQPAGVGIEVYLPPSMPWRKALKDKEMIGYITEGEKKAAKACKEGLLTIGLGGVDSFASSEAGVELHPTVRDFVNGRSIGIVYDSDIRTKPEVMRAARRLAERSVQAKADEVVYVDLPTGFDLDDYLRTHSVDDFQTLPTRPYDIKARVEAIRNEPKVSQRHKWESIRDLIVPDMASCGSFHYQKRGDSQLLFWFDNRVRKLFSLNATNERSTVARLSKLYGISGAEREWHWLYDALASHCVNDGSQSAIHSLVYGTGSTLYLFNGRSVFMIQPDGWKDVPNGTDGVLFHNPMLRPVKLEDKRRKAERKIDPMRTIYDSPQFVDTPFMKAEQSRLLFEMWLWSPLFPHRMQTRALPLLLGPKGSRKTSAFRRYLATIYGRGTDVSYFDPKKIDGLIALLASQHIAILDNIDGKHDGLANLLAVVTTGGEYTLRELYTTLNTHRVELKAFVGATSREPDVFRRDDIADRILPLNVERSKEFEGENIIQKATNRARGAWWIHVLDMLPRMLKALRDFTPTKHQHRMADFADFCYAVAPVLGYSLTEVSRALKSIEEERAAFSLETSVLPDTLRTLLASHGGRIKNKSASDLLEMLKQEAADFPFRSASSLGRVLTNQLRGLFVMGINVRVGVDAHTKTKTYTLTTHDKSEESDID